MADVFRGASCLVRGFGGAFMIGCGGMIRRVVVYQARAGAEARVGASMYSRRAVER